MSVAGLGAWPPLDRFPVAINGVLKLRWVPCSRVVDLALVGEAEVDLWMLRECSGEGSLALMDWSAIEGLPPEQSKE